MIKKYIHKNVAGTEECTLVYKDINQDIDITGVTICNTRL